METTGRQNDPSLLVFKARLDGASRNLA